MDPALVHHLSHDAQELARKREELTLLQAELVVQELYLATLQAELAAFEGRYLRAVGVLFAELDDWKARLAELRAQAESSEESQAAAAEARAQAKESYAAAHGRAAEVAEFAPSPELKTFFREVVRQLHPDYASDDADSRLRNRLMADANLAYRRHDEAALRRILDEYRSSPESVKGDGTEADLKRILLQIDKITERLVQIEAEVAELDSSEIALLMAKAEEARAKGRDLLAEMAKDVQHRIVIARTEVEGLCSEVK